MSRRIDIELTSDRGDGTWTWRAAGAKQPKGVVKADLLPDGATVGQNLRAEVETTLDGTDVLDVSGPKTKNRSAAETIELLPRGGDEPLVTQTLAGGRGGRDRGDRGDKRGGDRRGGDRGDRGARGPGGPRGDRPGGDRGPRGSGGPRSDRPGGDRSGPRDGDRSRGPRGDGDANRRDRPRRERPAAPPAKPKARRLKAGRAHRKVALATLSPEEQVLGEYVLAGGIPAVRAAVEKQNAQAQAEGGRKVSAAPLVTVAERLLPALRAAEWRDRAEAAVAHLDDLDLRDLRSVVVGAETAAKDDEALALSAQLREGLTGRVDREQAEWLAELAETLQEGRVVRALRLSSRPPKAGAPLPADLAARLAEATSASLTSDTFPDRWATVLDALSFSPARLTVVPVSKPAEPSEELLAIIRRMADRVPKVAEAFGIEPVAPARRGRGGRGGGKPRKKAPSGQSAPAKKIPAPPPLASTAGPDAVADGTTAPPAVDETLATTVDATGAGSAPEIPAPQPEATLASTPEHSVTEAQPVAESVPTVEATPAKAAPPASDDAPEPPSTDSVASRPASEPESAADQT